MYLYIKFNNKYMQFYHVVLKNYKNALRKPKFNHFFKVVCYYFKNIIKNSSLANYFIRFIFLFSTLWYFSSDLPDYKILSNYKPPVSSRVHSGEGQLIAEYAYKKAIIYTL